MQENEIVIQCEHCGYCYPAALIINVLHPTYPMLGDASPCPACSKLHTSFRFAYSDQDAPFVRYAERLGA